MGARDRLELEFELAVDRLQLFVDRLQFLLAGFQFLGGRAVFLVDRLQLFVGGAQFLVRRVGLLAYRSQPRLGQLEFLGEASDRFVVGLTIRRHQRVVDRLALDEHDDGGARPGTRVLKHRLDLQMDPVRRAVETHEDRQAERRLSLLEHAVEGRAQLEPQLRPNQVDHVAAQRSARGHDGASGVLREMDHSVRFIDQHAGRSHQFDGAPVHGRFAQRHRRTHGAPELRRSSATHECRRPTPQWRRSPASARNRHHRCVQQQGSEG
jgi:hypothetical protein